MTEEKYKARGVSADKNEVREAVSSVQVGQDTMFASTAPNEFGDFSSLILHSDDVGTKTSLAYVAWREGWSVKVWHGIAQDALAMNLDDCACSGGLGPFLISNTIARNAKYVTGEVVGAILAGYRSALQSLAVQGIQGRLVGGETSDCGDVVRTIFVGATVLTGVEDTTAIDTKRIQVGDVIVGFASAGRATWERENNSGIGSNGLTSARHGCLATDYGQRFPESFSPEMPIDLVYSGPYQLEDPLPGDESFSIGSALLSPTRCFTPLIVRLINTIGPENVHALIHCTGGGQTKIIRYGGQREKGLRFVKNNMLRLPPVFKMLQSAGGDEWWEMYKVYNMGHLLEAVVPLECAERCIQIAGGSNIEARVIGHVEEASGASNEVVVDAEGGTHVYS